MSKPVLFVSFRDLYRAENLRAIYDAYPGAKDYICKLSPNYESEVLSGKYDLMVSDDFTTISPGKCIMIWHGIHGGKSIGIDQPNHPYFHPSFAKYLTRIISAGTDTVPLWHQCTCVSQEHILPLGMPRTDAYICKHKGDGCTRLANKRAYLYVPTFREPSETSMPDIDWAYIDSNLTDDEIFAVKLHPVMKPFNLHGYRHIIEIPPSNPSAPYLYDADVVITDYSSIMFDAYILGIPVVLFEKLRGYTHTRGMCYRYPDFYSSRYVRTEYDLVNAISTARDLTDTEFACIRTVADACDGHACDRIISLINDLNN